MPQSTVVEYGAAVGPTLALSSGSAGAAVTGSSSSRRRYAGITAGA